MTLLGCDNRRIAATSVAPTSRPSRLLTHALIQWCVADSVTRARHTGARSSVLPKAVQSRLSTSRHATATRPEKSSRKRHSCARLNGSLGSERGAASVGGLRLITERQGRSLILTANRAAVDWYPAVPQPVLAESVLDRIINTAHDLHMDGRSYRPNNRPGRAGRQKGTVTK